MNDTNFRKFNLERYFSQASPSGVLEYITGEPRMDGSWAFDDDPNGLVFDYERVVLFSYEADPGPPPVVPRRRKTELEMDDNGDGYTDIWITIIRDLNGKLISSVVFYDDNYDGIPDRYEVCKYWQDQNGRERQYCVIRHMRFVDDSFKIYGWDIDVDGDGTIDRKIRKKDIYDETGFRVKTRYEYDDDNDGEIDRTKTVFYDNLGEVDRIEFDDDADGEPDRFWPVHEA